MVNASIEGLINVSIVVPDIYVNANLALIRACHLRLLSGLFMK
ncbi:hypothetical protein N646_1892 [Vibrio alginolyticus NBRC 15630 = ATCC 17749]|uniref:Uncharacterized protein n=1 Tax=Vibrio alginolyticus (strain ATCC 17749 / DSM 2171 / NBRC 15630 / NCIMB 1903 / NCTC 12160 / XII-53) TaxID=1219076 RepID=A0A2I3CBP1_VIBAX|nr:hypothetical protein N646_1892 [Vibrio alginolyticus NBRC 15630 = ATCC 17749]